MKTNVKNKEQESLLDSIVTRYAWGNSNLKTWFVTKNKKAFVPKGSKLLFTFSGIKTNEGINTCDTFPKNGDVVCDVDGCHIKINNINWI